MLFKTYELKALDCQLKATSFAVFSVEIMWYNRLRKIRLKKCIRCYEKYPIPVAVRTVDTGIGMKLPYIESSTVGEVVESFQRQVR